MIAYSLVYFLSGKNHFQNEIHVRSFKDIVLCYRNKYLWRSLCGIRRLWTNEIQIWLREIMYSSVLYGRDFYLSFLCDYICPILTKLGTKLPGSIRGRWIMSTEGVYSVFQFYQRMQNDKIILHWKVNSFSFRKDMWELINRLKSHVTKEKKYTICLMHPLKIMWKVKGSISNKNHF